MATTGTLLATQIVWVVMLVALIGSVIALVFSIIWRNNLRLNIVLITSVLVALLLVSIFNSVYNFTKWTYLSVPAAIIWIGLTVLSDYRFVVRMFLIVFASQAALLTTKVDQMADISWSTSIFPTAATVILIYICSVLLLITLLACLFKGKPQYSYRRQGYTYVLISLSSFGAICHAFCQTVRNQDKSFTLCVVSVSLSVLPVICYAIFRKHIKVFFGQAVEQKKGTQVGHLISIPADKTHILKRISSNYYIKTNIIIQENQSDLALDQEIITCTICLTEKCNTVVMPCGHMAACFECLAYYIDKRDVKCLICKTQMVEVCKVEEKDGVVKIVEQYGVRY